MLIKHIAIVVMNLPKIILALLKTADDIVEHVHGYIHTNPFGVEV